VLTDLIGTGVWETWMNRYHSIGFFFSQEPDVFMANECSLTAIVDISGISFTDFPL